MHTHSWVDASNDGPYSKEVCRICGKTKDDNSVDNSLWDFARTVLYVTVPLGIACLVLRVAGCLQ